MVTALIQNITYCSVYVQTSIGVTFNVNYTGVVVCCCCLFVCLLLLFVLGFGFFFFNLKSLTKPHSLNGLLHSNVTQLIGFVENPTSKHSLKNNITKKKKNKKKTTTTNKNNKQKKQRYVIRYENKIFDKVTFFKLQKKSKLQKQITKHLCKLTRQLDKNYFKRCEPRKP